jgi:hypothetical protein
MEANDLSTQKLSLQTTSDGKVGPETALQAARRELADRLTAKGLGPRDFSIVASRYDGDEEIKIFVMGDHMSDVAPKIRAVFQEAGFGSVSKRNPYTGYDQSYPQDARGITYSIVRDQKVRALGGSF